MNDLFDTAINFNDLVLRNIPAKDPKYHVFDDLSDNPEDWDQAEKICSSSDEIQYQAIENVFNRKSKFPSRFSDGSFPVWYGALELKTTFYETHFHWRRLLTDAGFLNFSHTKNPIYAIRKVFEVNCKSILIDIRSKLKKYAFILDPDIRHYGKTQEIGLKLSQEIPGLMTLSARVSPGINIVIFNKNILHSPHHYDDFLYVINPLEPNKTIIRRKGSSAITDHVEIQT